MNPSFTALLTWVLALACPSQAAGSPHAKLRAVDLSEVRWTDGFWAAKLELCRRAMLPSVEAALLDERNSAQLVNLKIAAGLEQGSYRGTDWSDGDCYKWIEAMAHMYAVSREAELDRKMDYWIGVIAKAQAPDGYLSTNIQLDPRKKRWEKVQHHALYNMGHLITAACAHQ
ncbi:MAG: glycoside hydrolase family 127 protein, partial [Verrucomicrobiae bacterium]|nr:glycoside hydrolase family 127 protein [Verrucomicrobiae bacterium]